MSRRQRAARLAAALAAVLAAALLARGAGRGRGSPDAGFTAGTTRVLFHPSTAAVDSLQPLLRATITRALADIDRVLPVEQLRIRVVAYARAVLPPFGISALSDAGRVDLFLDPSEPDLRQEIERGVLPTLAHEYYHVVRGRELGYGSTLFDALIAEGLAEQFVREVTGRQSPWLTSASAVAGGRWRERAAAAWCEPRYDHAAWFNGSVPELPRGRGFVVGYELVGAYLAAHPAQRPSSLTAEPAAAFLPPPLRGSRADCGRARQSGPTGG